MKNMLQPRNAKNNSKCLTFNIYNNCLNDLLFLIIKNFISKTCFSILFNFSLIDLTSKFSITNSIVFQMILTLFKTMYLKTK